jgi:DNA topoisomerase VI subunit A
MSIAELEDLEYASCLHKLTDNDIVRLQELKNIPAYKKVVNYMLEKNVKLEQEIVSLNLMSK